jgi:16S rRNA (uracil1498-N3)-methyltransferase
VITVLVSPDELAAGAARIEGDAYRHLFRARRLAVGDPVRATDGRGRARWGEVARVDRRSAALALGAPAPANEPAWRLELLVAAPRRERASWLVEKATELGASAVRLIAAERAPRDWGPGSLDRLRRLAAAALEQCHRAALPEVTGIHPWSELPALLEAAAARWVLDPAPGARLAAEALVPPPAGAAGALLVGPEGGWTDAERAELTALGCTPVTLGARVLRVETAALAGAALLLVGGHGGVR